MCLWKGYHFVSKVLRRYLTPKELILFSVSLWFNCIFVWAHSRNSWTTRSWPWHLSGYIVRMYTTKQARADYVARRLAELFPETPIPLDHKDAYTLLVAVLLSAQCTDVRVNQVTPKLWALADTPEAMAKVRVEKIQEIIRPCGLSPRKSKAIKELSQILVDKYDGQVPRTFEQLEELPGVGHKTASVVMSQAFGFPAFPVDTHIHRLAQRWKLTGGKNVEETEKDLKRKRAVKTKK